jgi:DNA-binding SARP family transcriptional activator
LTLVRVMASASIHLFGKFEVRCDQTILTNLPGGKMRELLCYLVLNSSQVQFREALATHLWPDCSSIKSKKCLRQSLWQLQRTLKSALNGQAEHALLINAESIRLDLKGCLSVDVTAFEQAYELARGVPGNQLDDEKARILGHAIDLYRGDLLEGCYEDWCLCERERLQNCYLSMLGKLMLYCQTHQDYQRGLKYGESALRLDRAHEITHRELMSLYYQEGNRTAALRQYHRCRKALQEELGVQPSRQTQELYERIQLDQDATPASSLLVVPPRPTSTTLESLETLLQCIRDAEIKIREEIQVIRRTTRAS